MAPKIIDTNNPHTLIVRWDDYGNICEAQLMRLRHIEIDGEVVKHEVAGPAILCHTDLANEEAIAALNIDALASVNRLNAEIKATTARLELVRKTLKSAQDQIHAMDPEAPFPCEPTDY